LEINELDIDSTSWNTGDSNQEMGLVSNKETYSGETLLRQYKDSGLSQEEFAKKMGMSRTTFWRRCGGKPSCDNGMKHPL
jgi:transcriptional regulator of acetoin/glycerol metabolism